MTDEIMTLHIPRPANQTAAAPKSPVNRAKSLVDPRPATDFATS
jgi:hypothetical protein